jgi:DNA-binding NtrC family response regulator
VILVSRARQQSRHRSESAPPARAEREVLRSALAQTGANLSKVAKLLGISRPTLYDLMQQHQIGLDA